MYLVPMGDDLYTGTQGHVAEHVSIIHISAYTMYCTDVKQSRLEHVRESGRSREASRVRISVHTADGQR